MKKPYIKAQIKTIETQTYHMLAESFTIQSASGRGRADVKQKMWDDDEDVEW